MNTLQQGATLQGGRYRILGVLGQGGFGITYIAEQTGLGRKVAIKEFFMKEWCERDASTSRVTLGTAGSSDMVSRFREKFMKEARNISRLNHPNIVRIHDVFEENGTAYYVMDYAEGGSLADLVKRKGCLSEADATHYILQVADALQYIHAQNMAHLDVKPANIPLNERGEAILIDFGLSKQYDATSGGQTSTTPVGISEGYAPMEQYRQGGVSEFSPETDIYSLGATFFKLLTGKTPPTASDIFEDGIPVQELKSRGVSQAAITIITQAMEPRRKQRMKDVKVFIQGLKGEALDSLSAHEGSSTSLTDNADDEESTKILTSYREGWAYQNDDSDDNEEVSVNSSAQQSDGQGMTTSCSGSAPQTNENTQIPQTVPEKSNEVKIIVIVVAAVVLLLIVVMCNSFGGNNSRDEGTAVCDSDSIACDTPYVDYGPVCSDAEAVPVGEAVIEEDAAPTEVSNGTLSQKTNARVREKSNGSQARIEETKEYGMSESSTGETNVQGMSDDDRIYEMVENNAQYPGGQEACYKFLQENLRYPYSCQVQGIEGHVFLKFVVNKDGTICDMKVAWSPHPDMSAEVIRVVGLMPRWIPATQDGRCVRARFTLPVSFRLSN